MFIYIVYVYEYEYVSLGPRCYCHERSSLFIDLLNSAKAPASFVIKRRYSGHNITLLFCRFYLYIYLSIYTYFIETKKIILAPG